MRALIVLLLLAGPAYANGEGAGPTMACMESARDMTDYLKREHGEDVKAQGYRDRNVMTVYLNPETETWTITVTARGQTCLVFSGEGWRDVRPLGDPL